MLNISVSVLLEYLLVLFQALATRVAGSPTPSRERTLLEGGDMSITESLIGLLSVNYRPGVVKDGSHERKTPLRNGPLRQPSSCYGGS